MAENNQTTSSYGTGSGNVYLFFFIILIFHIVDVIRDFSLVVRVPIYFVSIPILIWLLGIYKDYSIRNLAFIFLATFLEFYITKATPALAIGIAVTFFPISLLYFIFTIGGRGWYWLVRVPVIILILFLVMPPFISSLSEQNQIDQLGYKQSTADVFRYMTQKFNSGIGSFWTGTKNLAKETATGVKSTFKNSTGQQYYQGEVEKNANQKIGVYLENIKEADPFNYDNQEILLWATVKARAYEGSANENNEITITPSCVADRFDESLKRNGTIKQKPFTVLSYDEQDLDCTFPIIVPEKGKPKSLIQGEHTITFNAKFNFTTKAYKKAYFTDYELLRSLNKENIDIFQQYNLEKSPKAIYTNGPIEIGIETQDIITLRQDDNSRNPTIGFSLRNKQTGDLKKITKISLSLPAGLEIAAITDPAQASSEQKLDCNKKFTEDPDLTTPELNVYSLSNEEYKNNNKEELQSFRCTLKADKEKLMDQSPVVTRYFQITANYEYELHGSKTITVKASPQ